MPSEQLFNKFADIPALEKEKTQVKVIFGEIKSSIMELSNLGLKLDTTKGMNDIVRLQQQVGQLQDKLQLSQNRLAESEARLDKIRSQAALNQEKADAIRTKNIIAQNKELDRQIALEQKKAAAASKSSSEPKVQNMGNLTQQRQDYINSIPFESNIADLEKEAAAAENATTVLSELDAEQARIANDATAMNTALAEQATIMSEVATDVDNIVLKYDEFTGSMAENIKVQYENVAAINANKEQQTTLLAAIKQQGFATEQQVATLATLKEENAVITASNKELTATIRLQAQAFNAEQGSVAEMAAELELLQRSYAKLGASEQTSSFGKRLKAEIDILDPALKQAEEGIGKTGRQVGSYASSITKAVGGAFSYLRQLAYIIPGMGIAGILQAAITPAVELAKSLFEDADAARELAMELNKLSQEAADAKRDVADLADDLKYVQQLGKINLQINTANSPTVDKMKGSLDDLRALGIEAGKQIDDLTSNKIPKIQEAASTAYQEFLSQLSDKVGFMGGTSERGIFEQANGVEALFYDKLSENSKAAYDTYKKLNESLNELNKGALDKTREQNLIYRQIESQRVDIAKQIATEERNLALANAQALSEIEKSKAEKILNSDRSSQQQRLNGLRQYLNAEINAISAQNKSVQDNPESSPQERAASTARANASIFQARLQYEEKVYQLNEEYRLKNAKADHDYYDSVLKDDENFQRKLIDNTIGSIDTRQQALEAFAKDQLEAAKNNFNLQLQQSGFSKQQADEFIATGKYQIEGKKITNAELIQMQRAYESEILGITRENEQEATNIIKTEIQKQGQLRQESIDKIERTYSNRDLGGVTNYADEVIALNKANRDKLISDVEYDKKRRQIDNKYQQDSLQSLIDRIEEELVVYDGSNQRLLGAQVKLDRDREKLRKLEASKVNQYLIDRLEKEIEVDQAEVDSAGQAVDARIKLLEKLKKAQQDLTDSQNQGNKDTKKDNREKSLTELEGAGQIGVSLTDLSDTIHDKRIQQYEDQKTALESRYQTEIDYINKVYANSVDKQAKLDEANKRYAAQKAILDAKEREEQLRKARFDKANAIFQIVIGTAAAIIRDLANPVKVAFDIALGAIQLATASAAPLPTYAKGTNSAKGGLSIVGEAGREIGVEPSGRVVLWEKPTITSLIAGTKIFPNKVTEDILAAKHNLMYTLRQPNVQVQVQGKDDEILDELKQLNSKPPMIIVNKVAIETTVYYQKQIKGI